MTEMNIEARFKELEEKHESFKMKVKYGGLLFLILFAGFILMGSTNQSGQTLTLSKIIVPPGGLKFVTLDGKVFSTLSTTEYGGDFQILSNKERPIGLMSANLYGGGIIFFNHQYEGVAAIGAAEYGGIVHVLNDQEKSVGVMRAYKDGGIITINDNQEKEIWKTP
ncbi:MAG: hypothetical protein M1269_03255 [Chloroflexi bacterium]|nr:hypothetical protein [Chloroflexota bacterium]